MSSDLRDEHEGIQDDENNSGEEYTPTPEQEKAIRLVEKLFKKSKKWRANYDKNWLSDYKFFRGQQWETQRPSYRHSEVINMVFQAIQSSVPMITDTRPKFQFLPQEPSDIKFAEIINQVCENDWTRNNWLYRLTESVYDAAFYGVGFGYVGHDPKAKKGLGDICYESIDPFYVFPDPNSHDVNVKSKSLVYAEPVDVDVIKSEYPELGKFVKADLDDLAGGDKTDVENYYKLRLPIDQTKSLRESGGNVDMFLSNKALKKIAYVFTDETEEIEGVSDDGITPVFEKRLKYPNGRKIVIAGGVLLDDGPMQNEDGKIPYSRLTNYILPREFYGISDIEQLKGPQRIFNKLISFAMDVLTLMGNPIWIVDSNSDVDTDNLINKAGLVVEKNAGSEVRREEGVQLQPYVLQLIDRMRDWFDGLSGQTDVSRGANPSGVTAAGAIATLQEAAQTRVRLKARNLDAHLQDLGQMWLSNTLQYRTAPEIIRISGNQEAARFFQFHVESVKDELGQDMLNERGEPMRRAVVRNYNTDPMTGQGGFGDAEQIDIKGNLDVSVSTGSTLPFMKAQKHQDALNLFGQGLIDQEEVLKTMDWPNYKAVMARMDEKAMQQAQMQQDQAMQAEQAKAMAKAPPPEALPPEMPQPLPQ
jgi:hypothetical protein